MAKTYDSRSEFFEDRIRHMAQEIARLPKNDVLNINEDEYIDYLENEYSLSPIFVHRDKEEIISPRQIKKEVQCNPYTHAIYGFGENERIVYEGYEIKVAYPFEGDSILFFVRPNSFTIGGAVPKEIDVNDRLGKIIVTIECWDKNPDCFNSDKESIFNSKIAPLLTINPEVERFNQQLRSEITAEFHKRKEECLSENAFFRAINVSPNDVPYKVPVPTVKKKQVPHPVVKKQEYKPYPSMDDKMYVDILQTLYRAGQAMERKPSTYMNKGEEALRDLFSQPLKTVDNI